MAHLRVSMPSWIIKKRTEVMYLIVDEWLGKEHVNLMERAPSDRFYGFVAKHLNAYVQEGVMPPEEIASAIFNLRDDQLAGQKMTLRAGDYISLQGYYKKQR